MKNIHVLPTDKPSILSKFLCSNGETYKVNELVLMTKLVLLSDCWKNQNIYITNNEKIKEGDYYVHVSNDINGVEYKTINYCHKPHRKQDNEWYVDGMYSNQCKKIILSTDQDLIKDGVQGILDKFLEWFVKNPSCEEVEVENIDYFHHSLVGEPLKGQWKIKYKITIPKEELSKENILINSFDEEFVELFNPLNQSLGLINELQLLDIQCQIAEKRVRRLLCYDW